MIQYYPKKISFSVNQVVNGQNMKIKWLLHGFFLQILYSMTGRRVELHFGPQGMQNCKKRGANSFLSGSWSSH